MVCLNTANSFFNAVSSCRIFRFSSCNTVTLASVDCRNWSNVCVDLAMESLAPVRPLCSPFTLVSVARLSWFNILMDVVMVSFTSVMRYPISVSTLWIKVPFSAWDAFVCCIFSCSSFVTSANKFLISWTWASSPSRIRVSWLVCCWSVFICWSKSHFKLHEFWISLPVFPSIDVVVRHR